LVKDAVAAQRNFTAMSGMGSSLLPLPVLNLGMGKCGSMTLYGFFKCIGFHASHWDRNNLIGEQKKQVEFEGICMRDATRVGLPPLATCAGNKDAVMQMDIQFPFGDDFFATTNAATIVSFPSCPCWKKSTQKTPTPPLL